MKAERAISLFRDVGSITVGLGGIIWQLKTGPDPAVMAVLAGIAAIPGVANLNALRQSGGGTATPSSSSPSQPSSEPPGSSEQASLPTSST